MKNPRLALSLAVVALLALAGAAHAAAAITATPEPKTNTVLIDTVLELVDASSFLLSDRTLVTTGPLTVLVGLFSVTELQPGDLVQVEGSWIGDQLDAATVQLLQSWTAPTSLAGAIAYLDPAQQAFGLSDGTFAQVQPGTVYVGVAGYADLAPGDFVVVEGVLDTWTWSMVVDRLERVATPPGPTYVAFQGSVAAVYPPDRLELYDGSVLLVTPTTVLVNFSSLSDLTTGDFLWVEALTTDLPAAYQAVALTVDRNPTSTVAFQGTVATVDPSGSFTTVEGHRVVVDAATTWVDLDGLADLQPADVVWVEGTGGADPLDPLLVQAALVQLVRRGGTGGGPGGGLQTALQGAVSLLLEPSSFVLDDTWLVTTGASTAWLGTLTGYSDLHVGMLLAVTGTLDVDGSLTALSVENLDTTNAGVVTLSGQVAEADPANQAFRLSTGDWIIFTPDTTVDGDVDSVAEITVEMFLTAECVAIAEAEYRALSVFVHQPSYGPLDFELLEAGEALVVLVAGASPEEVADRHGATIAGRLPGRLVHLFTWAEPVSELEIQELIADPEVEEVDANYLFGDPESRGTRRRMPIADRNPSSAKYGQQPAATAVGLPQAHERSTGMGTMVAVLDTGVDPFHPLLRHRIAAGGWDFVDNDPSPWDRAGGNDEDGDGEVDEAAGHGTFVAGLVLLAAPGTTILPFRVLDDEGNGTTFAICQALLAAMDRGADVVNMSFAYQDRSRVLDRILDEAHARGVVLVSGAGNDASPDLPFPARDWRVIAVAAADDDGALAAEFSNFGADVTLAAPGVDLYSGLAAQTFGTWSGTSMAAPLVSGAAALLRSVNPRLTPEQIREALTQSLLPLAGDPHGVPGVLQVNAALDLVPDAP